MPSVRHGKRARDLDRIKACGALDAAYSDGQIDAVEHRMRVAAASSAATVGELQTLVADLQVPPDIVLLRGPAPPTLAAQVKTWLTRPLPEGTGRLRDLRGMAVMVVLCAGFISGSIWSLRGPETDPPGPAVPMGAPAPAVGPRVAPIVVAPAALHTPDGFRRFVDAVRAEFGTTVVADATIYADRATVGIPVPGSPGRMQVHTYEGGFDDPLTVSREADQPIVDLAAFDVDKILGLVAGVGESLRVENATGRYVQLRDLGDGPAAWVFAFNEFWEAGYLEARSDGSVTAVHPFEPS